MKVDPRQNRGSPVTVTDLHRNQQGSPHSPHQDNHRSPVSGPYDESWEVTRPAGGVGSESDGSTVITVPTLREKISQSRRSGGLRRDPTSQGGGSESRRDTRSKGSVFCEWLRTLVEGTKSQSEGVSRVHGRNSGQEKGLRQRPGPPETREVKVSILFLPRKTSSRLRPPARPSVGGTQTPVGLPINPDVSTRGRPRVRMTRWTNVTRPLPGLCVVSSDWGFSYSQYVLGSGSGSGRRPLPSCPGVTTSRHTTSRCPFPAKDRATPERRGKGEDIWYKDHTRTCQRTETDGRRNERGKRLGSRGRFFGDWVKESRK